MAKAPAVLSGTPIEQRDFVTACWNNQMDIVVDTVARAPDAVHWRRPDTQDTGLTYAAASGVMAYDVTVFLLGAGADIDAQNKNGMTPLMFGARDGSEAYVELFLTHGADQSLRNSDGDAAEDIAIASGRQSVADEFEKHRRRVARAAEEETQRAAAEKQKILYDEIATICSGTREDIVVKPAPTIKLRVSSPGKG
ncbi:MAG: ankyrin repeat domain-containing protein [Alphaproteobacteria bacterium]|nr:ankyrin repeat domain-containing protein [Alphaproteobacteria bacterium]